MPGFEYDSRWMWINKENTNVCTILNKVGYKKIYYLLIKFKFSKNINLTKENYIKKKLYEIV